MKEQKKNQNFIKQAGILASAGIVVRIIGIMYRTPLVMIIGDEGNGYYNTAYNFYTIILLISSYSIPSAISKVIAGKLGQKEYKNAFRLFQGSLVYVTVMGLLGSSICLFFADRLVGASSASVLRFFAPTIFLSGLLGCLRGFFQAQRTMVYTSMSQILEQIANALLSVGLAFIITNRLADRDATARAIGGATGSALGTGAGVLIALIYMIIIFVKKYPDIKVLSDNEPVSNKRPLLSPLEIGTIIFSIVTPVLMSTCIYNLSTVLNLKIYQNISIAQKGFSEAVATTRYGLFSGKSMNITNIPIAIASAMSSAIIPAVAHSYESGDRRAVLGKIESATRITMLIAIPCAFGLLAMARPVTMLLYPQRASVDIVSNMIKVLSVTVVFYCLSTLGNAILQGIGFVGTPVKNAAIALGLQTVVLYILVAYTEMDTYGLCIAVIVYSFVMCILNCASIRNKSGYRINILRIFVAPTVAGIIMALVAKGVFSLLSLILRIIVLDQDMEIAGPANALFLMLSVLSGGIVYLVLIIKLGIIRQRELRSLPGGTLLVKLCWKFGLLLPPKTGNGSKKASKK